MRRARLAVALAATALATGCVPDTGDLLVVKGPGGTTSVAAGVVTLDFVVAQQTQCGRWVAAPSVAHHRFDVRGRDLDQRPYRYLLQLSHRDSLGEQPSVAALAYDADGKLIGDAQFGKVGFQKDKVQQRTVALQLYGGTRDYVAGDGCVCIPGFPWVGTGSGSGCDSDVITSFKNLQSTAGCELAAGTTTLPWACDGQHYPNEPRSPVSEPCFASDGNGVCRVSSRQCQDAGGTAWSNECHVGDDDPALPTSELCDRYTACTQMPCGDVDRCFGGGFAGAANVTCTLRVDPTTVQGAPMVPCGATATADGGAGAAWTALLPGGDPTATSCLATVLRGTSQPPLSVGVGDANAPGVAQLLATTCPATVVVDALGSELIDYPMALPPSQTVDFVVGTTLTHVTFAISLECNGDPPLVCTAQ